MSVATTAQPRAPTPYQLLGRDLPRELADTERHRIVHERVGSARTRRNFPCPVCGEIDSQCLAYAPREQPTRAYVWCIRGDGRPGGVQLDWGFRKDRGGIWYFEWDNTRGSARVRPTSTASRDLPLADAATIDRVLQATARLFGLSDAHKAKLAARGYDPVSCGPDARYTFASLPADASKRSQAAEWALYCGVVASTRDLLGTYGFSQDRRHGPDAPIAFLPRVEGPALIEMVRDASGRIVGFQYAPDTPPRDTKGKPLKRLTPPRMAIGGIYHVARPDQDAGAEVWHTEAVHKANLTADHRSAIALGSLGAGNARTLLAGAQAIDPEARRLHVVALDADQWASTAEKQLAGALASAGFRVALARWDPKLKGPDDAIAAGASFVLQPFEDQRSKPRTDQRVTHPHIWQRREETTDERERRLEAAAQRIVARVRAHLDADERERILIIAAPPGVGKSSAVAKLGEHTTAHLGGEYDLAWIAERHEMRQSVPALGTFWHVERPSWSNCYTPELHDRLAEKGYNTGPVHAAHQCEYIQQFRREGATFYQQGHVRTGYPAEHTGGIVVDEMDVGKWLPEHRFTTGTLSAAAARFVAGSTADELLRSLQATITDAAQAAEQERTAGAQAFTTPHGRALFEALNARSGGNLAVWLGTLAQDADAIDTRPHPGVDPDEPDALEHAERLRPVVLPHIVVALLQELEAWKRGGEWNSRLRIGPTTAGGEWALYITRPLAFGHARGSVRLPSRVALDATADLEIHARLLGAVVEIVEEPVEPPPHMRHIAVRTGKRWGKMSQTAPHGRDLKRTAAELRYLLQEIDPDGSKRAAGTVGLITYQGCEQELAEALGLRYVDPKTDNAGEGRTGHFWGMRGSNRLEDCAIMLVVGTPSPNPEDVKRWARALYASDPEPLDEHAERIEGRWRYRDARLQHFADYLSRAELTQCAHRNRPLRYDGRTVVTLCAGAVDFLPITTEITSLPQLTTDGAERATKAAAQTAEKLDKALADLRARGEKVTTRALAATAGVSLRDVGAWWKIARTTYVNLRVIPTLQYESNSKVGIKPQMHIMSSPPSSSVMSAGADRRASPDSIEDPPDADVLADGTPDPSDEASVGPRQPLWSDALRVAGLGATDEEVWRVWRRLRVQASAARGEAS
jgi:hypothetical protein